MIDDSVEALMSQVDIVINAWQALARAEKHRSDWSDTADERKHIGYCRSNLRAALTAALAAERERCIDAAEQAYIEGKGAKGVIDAIRALGEPKQ